MKTLNDFLWWLSVCGLLQRYFDNVQSECNEHWHWLISDHIKNMDANNPDSLFEILSKCTFWDEPAEKYKNWLKENNFK